MLIIGGRELYAQTIPRAERMYLTLIHASFEGDTYFPEFRQDLWHETERVDHQPDQHNAYPYSFVILERAAALVS